MQKIYTFICLSLLLPAFLPAQDAITKGKELFGDLRARQIGPAIMSGRITDLELHPSNPKVIYAGTAGGGVWKSNDGGARFNSVFDNHCQSIGAVAVDPSAPDNVVWVGTGETWTRNSVSIGDGIYRSADGGINWTKMGLEKSERIASIIVNPKDANEVYVGVLGALWSDSEDRGVYKTNDGGKTWNKILYVDPKTGCADMAMDPTNPQVLYASFWEFRRTAWNFNSGGANSALYKSTDGGKSWNKIHKGFPSGKLGRLGIAIAPSNPNILYTVIESEQDKDKGLYRSDDAGASWKQLNNDFGIVVRPFYFSRITVDPRNPDVIAKGGLSGSISRDGGKTFRNLGAMHSDIHDVVFAINDSERLFAGTDGGVYRSWNGGTTMEIVENLPVSQFYQISVDNQEPYNIYGGLQDNNAWYGPSTSPGGIEARDWNLIGAGDGFRVLPHPTKRFAYSEMQGADNVWRIDLEKGQFRVIQPLPVMGDPKLRWNWNPPMATSPHQPDRFYMGSQFLHKSEDMGDTWVKISPDLTTKDPKKYDQGNSGGLSTDNSGAENHCTIFTIAESPLDEKVIWVGTDDGNVQVTQDGGKIWKNVNTNLPGLPAGTWCYHIEPSSFNKGTAYAVFDGHSSGDMKPYAYKTTNFGASWTSVLTPEVEGFVRNIQEDFVNPNLLFLGTEFGLYITLNGGKNWYKFTNNMPAVAVHFIEIQRKTNDLVMGTHGRGVIIIDDISPLRQINDEVLAKDLHFFKNRPAIMYDENGFGGTSGETQFVGPNPSRAGQIVYYLKKRHTLGKFTMEIQDAKGQKVAEITPGKTKGINIVEWGYTGKTPKIAKGQTLTFGAPLRVPAGKYKIVVQKGAEAYTHDWDIAYDPRSKLTLEDRKVKEQTIKKMFDMTQSLAYLVYELDETVTVANQLLVKDASLSNTITPMLAEFNKLKETLVVTTGDNYVSAGEPQLREKMTALYNNLATSLYKPSANELGNLKFIEAGFNSAKLEFQKLKDKHVAKLNELLSKNGMGPLKVKSFEEYLQMP